MILALAHIKEQSPLSLGSYGRPRMTEELKEIGLNVGHPRVGRLMRQNGISVVRTREGWLYLAVILDLHSRRVIGWAVNNRMKRDLAIFNDINGFYNARRKHSPRGWKSPIAFEKKVA